MNPITNPKIQPCHLEKAACVYVRQSTMHQVRENTASTELQYGLRERAVKLGWARERVQVYDGDLGVGGSVPGQRQSFSQLVADVGLGRVGIILGFDVTRLARNNGDWYRLLDMCAVCDTLVADVDGVYDVSLPNDRLLLGMKGAMSEAEHHLIRTRLTRGMRKRAEAGEFRTRLPVGYDYDEAGHVVMTADEHVRRAIELVFRTFERIGSARQVHAFLQGEKLLLPSRRPGAAKVTWGPPRYAAVHELLTNPCYAGAYVYGKTRRVRSIGEGGAIVVRMKVLPRAQWQVVIEDHHPGYITREQYDQNQQRIEKNTLLSAGGEASTVLREGRGLLHSLLRCGHCGRRMSPTYPKDSGVRYTCKPTSNASDGRVVCQSVGGARLEKTVVDAFLDALSPASMQVTLEALERMDGERDVVAQQLEDRLEETRFQTDRAQRKFDEVEPGNRKVARVLETEWNQRLVELEELERQVVERRRHRSPPLSAEERARLLEFGLDLREIWTAPTTTAREKKLLLQAALADVFVTVDAVQVAKRRAHLTLVWQGGAKSELSVPYPRPGQGRQQDDVSLIDRIRAMAGSMTDVQIAQALGRWRIRTTTGLPFNLERVSEFRKRHGIPSPVPETSSDAGRVFTARAAAAQLGVSLPTVLSWLNQGFLSGEQSGPYAAWRIRLPDSVRLEATAQSPRGWLPLKEAARVLGISRRQLLEEVKQSRREAVLAGQGRRRGLRINVASPSKTQGCLW
ncbi:MAG TPA: recombinase family protein [Polyangiaceae bacterium]|nr:recombinase family protein [Polyangiaceae bacterium]